MYTITLKVASKTQNLQLIYFGYQTGGKSNCVGLVSDSRIHFTFKLIET